MQIAMYQPRSIALDSSKAIQNPCLKCSLLEVCDKDYCGRNPSNKFKY